VRRAPVCPAVRYVRDPRCRRRPDIQPVSATSQLARLVGGCHVESRSKCSRMGLRVVVFHLRLADSGGQRVDKAPTGKETLNCGPGPVQPFRFFTPATSRPPRRPIDTSCAGISTGT
jgi:hypothetical protein